MEYGRAKANIELKDAREERVILVITMSVMKMTRDWEPSVTLLFSQLNTLRIDKQKHLDTR